MPKQNLPKSLIAWKYYLLFLWLTAAILAGFVVYGFISVQIHADENPAGGLAMTGVFGYLVVLTIYCGFILFNRYIKRKIGHNVKASWWFLSVSWLAIGLLAILSIAAMIIGVMSQDYYEKNVLPKEQACYEDFLNGKRATPHCTLERN